MIVMKHRYCNECRFFIHVPFTVGRCGRKDASYPPSITDERATRCGPSARFFIAKTQEAA